jgi:hypothetical protein
MGLYVSSGSEIVYASSEFPYVSDKNLKIEVEDDTIDAMLDSMLTAKFRCYEWKK